MKFSKSLVSNWNLSLQMKHTGSLLNVKGDGNDCLAACGANRDCCCSLVGYWILNKLVFFAAVACKF